MSGLTPFQKSAVLGLCRERVPLGVQARGLNLDRHDVKAAALELFKNGEIGELPADDIRGGRVFSWPETMLPDAPDFEQVFDSEPVSEATASAPPCALASVTVPIPAASPEASPYEFPSRYWQGRRLSDRHAIVAMALAEAPAGTAASIGDISEGLKTYGYSGARTSVQVCISELKRKGFVITFDFGNDGYVLGADSRAAWMGGNHA